MTVDLRMLQKFSGSHARREFLFRQELIILAFRFACSCWPRGARDRVNELGCFSQSIDERRFAGARWRGNDEKNSVTAKAATQGFEFVRGFFPAPLCKRRLVAKSRHRSPWLRVYSVRGKFPEL